MYRYFVQVGQEVEREVSKEEYMQTERNAGFSGPDGQLATSSFSGIPTNPDEWVRGRVVWFADEEN